MRVSSSYTQSGTSCYHWPSSENSVAASLVNAHTDSPASLHVPYSRPWLLTAFMFFIISKLTQALRTSRRTVTAYALPGGMTKLEIDGCNGWRAGQHIRLRVLRGRRGWQSHPYTIAGTASDSDEGTILVYAKGVGAWSRALRDPHPDSLPKPTSPISFTSKRHSLTKAISDEKISMGTALVEGPYGFSYNVLADHDSVLLIAGGSGITYALSYLEHIKPDMAATLIWAVRDSSTVSALLPFLETHSLKAHIRIHITQHPGIVPTSEKCAISLTRPDLTSAMKEAVGEEGTVLVAVCGSARLTGSTRDAIGRLDRRAAERVNFEAEAFAQ